MDNPLEKVNVVVGKIPGGWLSVGLVAAGGLYFFMRSSGSTSPDSATGLPADSGFGGDAGGTGGGFSSPGSGGGTADNSEFNNAVALRNLDADIAVRDRASQLSYVVGDRASQLDYVKGLGDVQASLAQNDVNILRTQGQIAVENQRGLNSEAQRAYESQFNFLFSDFDSSAVIGPVALGADGRPVPTSFQNTGGNLAPTDPVGSARDRESRSANKTPTIFVKGIGMVPENDPRNPGYKQYIANNQSEYGVGGGGYSVAGDSGGYYHDGTSYRGFGDEAAIKYGDIRTVGQDTAPQFSLSAPQTRADYLYNASARAGVDAFNMAERDRGYGVDIAEYQERRQAQEGRDTIRQQQDAPKGISINTPWGGFSYGGSGGTVINATPQRTGSGNQGVQDARRTLPKVATPTTFPRNSGVATQPVNQYGDLFSDIGNWG